MSTTTNQPTNRQPTALPAPHHPKYGTLRGGGKVFRHAITGDKYVAGHWVMDGYAVFAILPVNELRYATVEGA